MQPDPREISVEHRVDEIIAEYLVRIDQGEQIDREEFIREHAEIADDLRAYFADSEAVGQAVRSSQKDTDPNSQSTSILGPRVLGNYVVLRRIGEGGMGQVYKARHQRMKRIVALKILPKEVADSPEAIQRFQQEVEAAARLSHPNIVTAHDADEADGVRFLVMEYVDGCDLARLVRQRGPLPVAEVLDYMIQAARGLEYAHAHGVIHRDIKPSNLLLDREGRVKVLDMGLARLSHGADSQAGADLTQTGAVMGTMDYMSPEQAEDTHQADARSDIYSLGCTLFKLLTGKPVHVADTVLQRILAHREAPVPSLMSLREDVPEELDALLRRMLAKRPDERPGSMGEVIAELERCSKCLAALVERTETYHAQGTGDTAKAGAKAGAKAVSLPASAERRGPPRRRIIIGAAMLGFALVGVLFGVVLRFRTTEGTLVVEVSEPDAHVEVDGGKFTITTPGTKEPVKFQVDEGKHTLRVTKGGFESFAKQFTIHSGGKEMVRVMLQATTKGPQPKRESTASSAQPAEGPLEARASKSPYIGQDGNWKLPPGAPAPAIAPFDEKKAKECQEAWATHLGTPVEMTNSIGMKFVVIPPGEFDMGSTEEDVAQLLEEAKRQNFADPRYFRNIPTEAPKHRVKITTPFYLGQHEVRVAQFRRFVEDAQYKTDAEKDGRGGYGGGRAGGKREQKPEYTWRNPGYSLADDQPVANVSWNDAVEFCNWLSRNEGHSYRLPTEAEWEYACRAGSTTKWCFGDDKSCLGDYAWYNANSNWEAHPVGQKQPNAWTLYDLYGNVWEWCADWYNEGHYAVSPPADPGGPPYGVCRVLRGGSWFDYPRITRSAYRNGISPVYRSDITGFRVSRTP